MLFREAPYKNKKEYVDMIMKNWEILGEDYCIRLGESLKKIKNTE